MKRLLVFIVVACCGSLAEMSRAQTAGGSVSGLVTDPSGASVPRAQVLVRSLATRSARALTTNLDGFYIAPNLIPGDYEVTISAGGFETQVAPLTMRVGDEQELNFTLRVGSVDQKLEVAGPASGIELASSEVGAVVERQTIQELPLNGRSWTDLAALEPGTVPIETQLSYTAGNSRGNRGFGAQLAVSGARPQQNNYRLDGISINDYSNGGPGSVLGGNLGVDAVEEFSLFTGNYSAAYGKASGGVINATTRSGANEFHGSAYDFLRNSALDARNFFDKTSSPPPFRRNQFGGSAGGPLVRDKTFVFADYEGIRQSTGVTNIVTVPSAAARAGMLSTGKVAVDPAVARYLPFYPLPNAGLLGSGDTGIFSFVGQQVANEDFATTRIDHYLSDRDRLSGTYRFDNARFTTPDSLDTELVGSSTRNQAASAEENHVFGPASMNSFRAGISRVVANNNQSIQAIIPLAADVSLGAVPDRTAANVAVPGLTAFTGGIGGAGAYFYHYTSIQVYDDFFHTHGRHSFKFGFALERMRDNTQAFAMPNGQFNFGSLSAFLTNQPTSFQLGAAATSTPRSLRQTLAAGYFQDDWRLRPNLTVNLGLRYETTTVPTEVNGKLSVLRNITDPAPHLGDPYFDNPTHRNFEPRAGLSWDPFGDGRTAVRAGFGIYDVLPLPYEFQLLSALAAPFYAIGSVTNPPARSFPSGAAQILGPTSAVEAYIEPHPHRDYVMQWTFNVQRNLTRDLTVTAGYAGSRGVHQPFRTDDLNVVLPQNTPAEYLWPSPAGSGTVVNPRAGQIRGLFWDENSSYNALEIRAVQRFHHGFQVQASFTWSKSIDSGSSTLVGNAFSNSIAGLPWYDLSVGRGVSDFNVPRVAVINGIWQMPFAKLSRGIEHAVLGGWQLGGIFKAMDGIPFSPQIAGDPLGQKSTATIDFPNRLAAPGCGSAVNPGNPLHYIQTPCFAFPVPAPLLGNSGRNILSGPGLVNADLSLEKNTPIPGLSERFRAQWRAEFFNAFNRANFLPPINNLKLFDAAGRPLASAGLLDSTATPSRQIQFGLKLIW
jgi:Carboxypeptidase regulatory-like domain/TonB-dependent Receptor Plug Domain/TonB dependent receptor